MFTLPLDLCNYQTNKGQEGKRGSPNCKSHKTYGNHHGFIQVCIMMCLSCLRWSPYLLCPLLYSAAPTPRRRCSSPAPNGGRLSWPLSAIRKAIVPKPNCLKEVLPSAEWRCHPVLFCICPETPSEQEGWVELLPGRSFF